MKKEIIVSKEKTDFINKALSGDIGVTVSETADFGNGIEMDIKVCNSCEPWTEAVLFLHGSEVCCSEPCVEYFGDWELEYNNETYLVSVIPAV